jgi:hypothetical protein
MKSSSWPVAVSIAITAGLLQPAPAQAAPHATAIRDISLTATVLTFEGGLFGIQPFFYFTPMQLRGDLCASPNTCDPVYYPAIPLGQGFNDRGADRLQAAVDARAGDPTPITLFGHSQGGQVIYTALRHWAVDPSSAPDPAKVSWVSIGNPENAVGGRAPNPVPADSPYTGIEVIKQYDGWADAPTDKTNLLAVLNAAVGQSTTHVFGYFNVDLDDPDNIQYTPDDADGNPGKITYVFVPNPMLPLVEMTGLLAPLLNPILDPILRPIVESAYQRPFDVPAPVVSAATVSTPRAASVVADSPSVGDSPSVDVVSDPVPEVKVLNDSESDQEQKQHQGHHRRSSERGRPERLGVDPVGEKVGASRRAAAGQRVDGVKDLRRADHAGD